jgi:hypothetical protein
LARFLAIDADSSIIQVLAGQVKGGHVRLERWFQWEAGSSLSLSGADEIGRVLRERLREERIAPAPLLGVVGRERVVLKELRIPSVPEHEEPALVRFQALKELADSGDDVVLDYVPLGPAGPQGKRVQCFRHARDLVKSFRRLADAAGLKLQAITPRPFALLASWRHARSRASCRTRSE